MRQSCDHWGNLLLKPRLWGVLIYKLGKMVELNLADTFLCIFKSKRFIGKNPLLGKWISNRDATIDLINNSTELSTQLKEILLTKVEYGKLVLDFDETKFTSTIDAVCDSNIGVRSCNKEKGADLFSLIVDSENLTFNQGRASK